MLGFDHNLGGFNLVLDIGHELLGKRRTAPLQQKIHKPKKSFPHGKNMWAVTVNQPTGGGVPAFLSHRGVENSM